MTGRVRHLAHDITIDAPVDSVFAVTSEWTVQHRWMLSTRAGLR